ncbi:hypothetical protein BDW74DRAFT_151477 [Aspergillus multicolor]|uniref:uncharacterized protein n=1 Tax=Aspergillus multicolor TaxID=41759 RepID=UPI003CCCE75F
MFSIHPIIHTPTYANARPKVEDYRPGYPRFTALISEHSPYLLCRSFKRLRARILLFKQDKLCQLESKLDILDKDEKCAFFLSSVRRDRNSDRRALMSEIEVCLADYGQFIHRTNRTLSLDTPAHRDIEALNNWVDGNATITTAETAYLKPAYERDLLSLAPSRDSAIVQLET